MMINIYNSFVKFVYGDPPIHFGIKFVREFKETREPT